MDPLCTQASTYTAPIKMALVVYVLIMGFCIQPLSANNSTQDPSSTADDNMSTVVGTSTAALSTVNQAWLNMSTSTSDAATLPESTVVATGSTQMGSLSTEISPGSTETTPEPTEKTPEPTSTTGMTDVQTTVMRTSPNQVSTERVSVSTMSPESDTTMIMKDATSSTSSTTLAVKSTSGGGLMTTSEDGNGGGPAMISVAVYIAVGIVCGLVLLVIIFAVGVWCMRRHKSGRRRKNKQPFDADELDKVSPKDRMSMHRPESYTESADDDLAFVTFSTGGRSQVDGIENPTYAMTTITEKETAEIPAGAGDQDGGSTMPSTARLSVEGNIDGAVQAEPDNGSAHGGKGDRKGSGIRPQSGVSYLSADIDGALETLDIGTV